MSDDLVTLRNQTTAFITINPVIVNLQRQETESDGAGGVRRTLGPVGDQIFRKITQATSPGVLRRTIDGQEVMPEFVLLGKYDADVKNGDWFYQSGIKYEIVYVRDDRRYETWSEVAYRG